MPLYEYKCAKCGDVLEVLQKFSDLPLKKHQGCGGKLEKLISRSGIQFKGSGWYITDYARAGSQKSEGSSEGNADAKTDTAAEAPAKADGAEAKSDSKKSEAKPDTKKSSEAKKSSSNSK